MQRFRVVLISPPPLLVYTMYSCTHTYSSIARGSTSRVLPATTWFTISSTSGFTRRFLLLSHHLSETGIIKQTFLSTVYVHIRYENIISLWRGISNVFLKRLSHKIGSLMHILTSSHYQMFYLRKDHARKKYLKAYCTLVKGSSLNTIWPKNLMS